MTTTLLGEPSPKEQAAPNKGRFTFDFKVANSFVNLKLPKPLDESMLVQFWQYPHFTHKTHTRKLS